MEVACEALQSLVRIQAWVAREHPDRMPFLRPAAGSDTIARVEAKFGQKLPPELRKLYAAHDGQLEGTPSLYINQRWLPLELAAVAWEDLCLRYSRRDDLRLAANANGPATQQAWAWSPSWLPLFGSPRGDHYCIDLRRDRPARYGQIIWFLYDRPERSVVSTNVSQLFQRVADGLETGEWRLDSSYDGLSD